MVCFTCDHGILVYYNVFIMNTAQTWTTGNLTCDLFLEWAFFSVVLIWYCCCWLLFVAIVVFVCLFICCCCFVCVCVCVCACVRECVRVCVRACVRARVRMHACLNITHVFAGVCLWKKPGRARGRENVRVRFIHIFLLRFILFYCLNVPS